MSKVDHSVVEENPPLVPVIATAATTSPALSYGSIVPDESRPPLEEQASLLATVVHDVTIDEANNNDNDENDGNDESERFSHYHNNSLHQRRLAPQNSSSFRDWPWALLFLVHLGVLLYLGWSVAPQGYDQVQRLVNASIHNITTTTSNSTISWSSIPKITQLIREEIERESNTTTATSASATATDDNFSDQDWDDLETALTWAAAYGRIYPARLLMYFVVPMALIGYGLVILLAVGLLVRQSATAILVPASLVLPVVGVAMATIVPAVASGSIGGLLGSGLALAATGWWVRTVWPIRMFAATVLQGAANAVAQNSGVYLMAWLAAELSVIWPLYWTYVVVGVGLFGSADCLAEASEHGWVVDLDNVDDDDDDDFPVGPFLLLLLSLYWTSTVVMNTLQVSVAGIVATWCFDKQDANQCCSPAVFGSLQRSLTYSFGSICLGSLLQAIMSCFRIVIESARNHRQQRHHETPGCGCGDLLLCLLECIAELLDDVLEYFNQWAYVYVGIYGFSYLESGRKVIELFRARGWTAVINNQLVSFVLGFLSLLVGVVVGLDAVLYDWFLTKQFGGSNALLSESMGSLEVEGGGSFLFGPIPCASWWAFGIGGLLGIWVSSVAMNVIRGAVNTLIVCFADAPAVVRENHWELADRLADAWTASFPAAAKHAPNSASLSEAIVV